MKLDNLVLVEGKPFEQIVGLLDESEVLFRVVQGPIPDKNYFRRSLLLVHENDKEDVIEALGSEGNKCGGRARDRPPRRMYFAKYEAGENFSFRGISGKVTVDNGLLERIDIDYISDERLLKTNIGYVHD